MRSTSRISGVGRRVIQSLGTRGPHDWWLTSYGDRGTRPSRASASTRAAQPAKRSEEHTSELQSQSNLVCRLLLEKKKIIPRASYAVYSWLLPRQHARASLALPPDDAA